MKAWTEWENEQGRPTREIRERLGSLVLETPSWGYGDSGTRFYVFHQEGVPRNPYEKLEDAAEVHRLTGVAPRVAVHIPWDRVEDFSRLAARARELGVQIGSVNPNLFQDDRYRLGSLCHEDPQVRRAAVAHVKECVDIARQVGSKVITLWLPDGTNYPGQGSFRRRKAYLEETLAEIYASMDPDMTLLIEYKLFEPAFYHTDIADWGMAATFARKLGERAKVLVDLGHHAHGVNVEHIVAFLLDEGLLGGFHFNDRHYADDDLIVASANPYRLFLILVEIAGALEDGRPEVAAGARGVQYMIDQSHVIEPKIPAMLRSVENVQIAWLKALLVDRSRLLRAQQEGDVLGAEAVLREAFETDVRPLLREWREERGLPADPMAAYLSSGYGERIRARGRGGMGWQ